MKTLNFKKIFWVLTATGLGLATMTVSAQDTTTNIPSQASPSQAPPSQAMPVQLGYGASQILQLAQAKVGDDTIVAYIKHTGNSYALDVDQIIYLRQQGVSDAVLNTMLTQPRAGVASTAQPPQNESTSSTQVATDPAPSTTYVQTAPATTVYVPTTTYYYSYPSYDPYYYGWSYPIVSFGYGGRFGGGFYGGGFHNFPSSGGFRGGNGGFHGGPGGFHGGGSPSGGGFHGGHR